MRGREIGLLKLLRGIHGFLHGQKRPPGEPAACGKSDGGRLAPKSYPKRSTILDFMPAMALAGLRPLGQALVQFIIVWQR